MKKAKQPVGKSEPVENLEDTLLDHYDVDYSKAKPNRFAGQPREQTIVMLDVELSKIFRTEEEVINALRLLVQAMPTTSGESRKKTTTA